MIYAHSLPDAPESEWEPLADHLRHVSSRAASFAHAFGAAPFATVMGALHDIGKRAEAYQRYIRAPQDGSQQARGPDHSTAGAREAIRLYGSAGRLMAFGIAGHHGGLMDGPALTQRQAKSIEEYAGWEAHAPALPDLATLVASLHKRATNGIDSAFSPFFLARMLFSCLVDADFLETERFYASAKGLAPPARGGRLDARHRDALRADIAKRRSDDTPVNALRSQVLDHALGKATLAPGLFTLTVPTGGGKTLTSLSFALEHALHHGLERIIFTIPFAGAWIETSHRRRFGPSGKSPLPQGRGSKPSGS